MANVLARWRFHVFRAVYQHRMSGTVLLVGFTCLAWVWRRLLFRTTFIGITGSVGKTSTKDVLALILAHAGSVEATRGSQNNSLSVARQILRVRPWHRYCVVEVAAWRPGRMWLPARTLRPDLAIVLCVSASHRKSFASNEEIAAEKVALVRAVLPSGTAILNADDPLVRTMAGQCRGAVQLFARSPEDVALGARFAYHGEDAGWPGRFRFQAHDRQLAAPPGPFLKTQFVGDQWGVAFAAAYAAARVLGLAEETIYRGMQVAKPYTARMEPVALPNGVTFIRDEFKNDPAPFAAAARFLHRARAKRRVAIIGPASDTGLGSRDAFREMARALHGAAELYVFVGSDGDCAAKVLIDRGVPRNAVRFFRGMREANDALPSLLQAGDLVLLKGRSSIHLSRLFHAQLGPVACFKNHCSIAGLCDFCPELRAG